jgi:transposase
MAETIQEERWRWLKPIINKEMRLVDVAKICPHSERSLKRWKKAYAVHGMDGLIPKSTEPKASPKETPIRIKEEVIALRKQTKLCALKLHWKLEKQGLMVPARTIGKILKQEGLVRKYRVKKITYKYLRAERQPGELVEIDVKYVPGMIADKRYYQYTAIDTASRWRYLRVFEEQTTYHSILFLEDVIARFPHPITGVKTDNGSIFTNYYVGTNKRSDLTVKTLHALDIFCREHGLFTTS